MKTKVYIKKKQGVRKHHQKRGKQEKIKRRSWKVKHNRKRKILRLRKNEEAKHQEKKKTRNTKKIRANRKEMKKKQTYTHTLGRNMRHTSPLNPSRSRP